MQSNIQLLPNYTDLIHQQVEKYRDLTRRIKALESEKEFLSKELKEGFFKDNDEFVYDGLLLMTCTTQISERIDTKTLKEKKPEIYNLFQVETVSRVLRLK